MSGLAFSRAPRPTLPLRFLLAAPAWGVLAGILLLVHPDALASGGRWAPATVALVHVFTLGVLGNAMLGSLVQFLPVAADTPVAGARLLPLAHAALNLGLVLFLLALYRIPLLLAPGAALLALGALLVLAPPLPRLLARGAGRLRAGIGAALLALGATTVLGLVAVAVLRGQVELPLDRLVDAHATLGAGGWILGLLAAVGSITVPMFQGTAQVPPRMQRAWTVMAIVLPLGAAAARLCGAPAALAGLALAGQALAFAAAVLWLQWRAPHRRNPSLVRFWAAGSLCLALAAFAASTALPGGDGQGASAVMLAAVLALGAGIPMLVTGMLLEIVAFIAWVDLRARCPRGIRIPAVGRLQPEQDKRRVLALHLVAAMLLPAALAGPAGAIMAGVALASAHAATTFCLLRCLWRARHFHRHPEAYR